MENVNIYKETTTFELGSEGGRDWEDIDISLITENKYKQFGIKIIPRKVSRESEKREWSPQPPSYPVLNRILNILSYSSRSVSGN